MSLKSLALEAENMILGDPRTGAPGFTAEQIAACQLAATKVGEAIAALQGIPDRLFKIIGHAGVEVIIKVSTGWKLENLAVQMVKASPRLLEPHRAVVEDLVSALTGAGRGSN